MYSTEILLNAATIREVNSTGIDSNVTARETQRVPNRFGGMRDLAFLRRDIWDLS